MNPPTRPAHLPLVPARAPGLRALWSRGRQVMDRLFFRRPGSPSDAPAAEEWRTLGAVHDGMTEGLLMLDGHGGVRHCNSAAAGMLGLPLDRPMEVPGRLALQTLLGRFEPEDALVRLLAGASDGLATPFQVELRTLHDDPLDLLVTAFPIPVGRDERMIGLFLRDVTAEREVKRRQDQFVSIASHELRTPMTTIMGFAELLLGWDGLGPKQRRWVQHIHNDSRRLTGIVENLLDVSRIESGRLAAVEEPLSLREVMHSVVAAAWVKTDVHRFAVQVEADADDLVADRDKVVQVLTNLVANAVGYSPGGGTITLAAGRDRITGSTVVSVADQGIGVPPGDMDRLFTPFDRIRRPDTEGVRGTGLGLYIVKGLVEFMGGRVWAESTLGRGSTFYFSLPSRPMEAYAVPVGSAAAR